MKTKWLPSGIGFIFLLLVIFCLPQIQIDNSLKRWVPEGSAGIDHYRHFLDTFGGDAMLIVAFEIPRNITREDLHKRLSGFEEHIKKLSEVKRLFKWPSPLFKTKKTIPENIRSYVITFEPPSYLNPNRPELIDSVQQLMEKTSFKGHLAGTGVIYQAINNQTKESLRLFLIIGIAVLLCVLFFILRKPTALLLSLAVSIGGVLSLLLGAALFKIPLNIANTILPILVLFYSTSCTLHILFHDGNLKAVIWPCLVAASTTICGFLVFIADPVPLLNDFAILAIFGIAGGLLWAVILFYSGSYTYKPRRLFVSFFNGISFFKKSYILPVFLTITLIMGVGLANLKTDIYSLSVLPETNKAVVDHAFIEKNIGNYFPLEYVLNYKKSDAGKVRKWIETVYKMDKIDGSASYLSFPPFIDAQKFGYKAGNDSARITFLAPLLSTSKGLQLVNKINIKAAEILNSTPRITGFVTLYGLLAAKLNQSFINSLLLAFLAIFTIIALFLRDIRLIIAAIFPNVFPIIVILGLMGWLDISLDMVTVPIGCLLFSIIVDDTMHFLYWYKKSGNFSDTYKKAGPGIVYTSLVLIAGFSVFLFSSSPPIQNFGILSITALVSATVADLFMLPAIIYGLEKYFPRSDKNIYIITI